MQARKENIPLLALFVISPQDYIAHDRSPRRIDFVLRNLVCLKVGVFNYTSIESMLTDFFKKSLSDLHIPLIVMTHKPRKTIPQLVLSLCEEYGARALYANLEYEVDELRRDIQTYKLAQPKGIHVTLLHDKCIVEPGTLVTKQNKAYAVRRPLLVDLCCFTHTNVHILRCILHIKGTGLRQSTRISRTIWRIALTLKPMMVQLGHPKYFRLFLTS